MPPTGQAPTGTGAPTWRCTPVYTNAQVADILARLDRKIDLLIAQRAAVVPASAPTVVAAASPTVTAPITIPDRKVKAARYGCSLHPDHKDGKGYSENGIAFHRANGCKGETLAL
jgi:hypothetical protein